MVEGMTVKDFFQWGVYEGAKKYDKKMLKKYIKFYFLEKKNETYEEMMQTRWALEVYAKLLLPKAVI
jgi:hypothetical protein